jgi:hypothetical protein
MLLGYFILYTGQTFTTIEQFLIHFLPRLSLVVFIQIFAYFFLRLYKSTLEEIRYYQNEVTNVQHKKVSFIAIYQSKSADSLIKVVERLVETERNNVLKKGESTVDLAHAKADFDRISEIIGKVSRLVPSAH